MLARAEHVAIECVTTQKNTQRLRNCMHNKICPRAVFKFTVGQQSPCINNPQPWIVPAAANLHLGVAGSPPAAAEREQARVDRRRLSGLEKLLEQETATNRDLQQQLAAWQQEAGAAAQALQDARKHAARADSEATALRQQCDKAQEARQGAEERLRTVLAAREGEQWSPGAAWADERRALEHQLEAAQAAAAHAQGRVESLLLERDEMASQLKGERARSREVLQRQGGEVGPGEEFVGGFRWQSGASGSAGGLVHEREDGAGSDEQPTQQQGGMGADGHEQLVGDGLSGEQLGSGPRDLAAEGLRPAAGGKVEPLLDDLTAGGEGQASTRQAPAQQPQPMQPEQQRQTQQQAQAAGQSAVPAAEQQLAAEQAALQPPAGSSLQCTPQAAATDTPSPAVQRLPLQQAAADDARSVGRSTSSAAGGRIPPEEVAALKALQAELAATPQEELRQQQVRGAVIPVINTVGAVHSSTCRPHVMHLPAGRHSFLPQSHYSTGRCRQGMSAELD